MVADAPTNSEIVTKPRGRPFPVGNNANPHGRPKKGTAIRDLLKAVPVARKRELVKVAYEEALEKRDVHWAEWIARHSGESGSRDEPGHGAMRELIIREYADWPAQIQ